MEKETVIVTGIGGNVGQGILRNIRHRYPQLRLVGTNTVAFSAGNHLCDAVYEVPYAYHEGYIPAMAQIVAREHAKLIVPSTDYEVYHLALARHSLPAQVLASDAESTAVFLDKYLTYTEFSKHGIPFAASCLPAQYQGQYAKLIAKPRKGRGSRGIVLDPPDASVFSDEYLLQERVEGPEITTAFYVTRQGELLGHITLERTLENGTTTFCKVTRAHDVPLEKIIRGMMAHFSLRGSINIQSIVRANGEIVPFEINARISGTNSIRSNFGFEDVAYGIEEWLYGRSPQTPQITDGIAIRMLTDVIYPGISDTAALNASTKHHLF